MVVFVWRRKDKCQMTFLECCHLAAAHCNILQYTATYYCDTPGNTRSGERRSERSRTTHCNTLQHTATHCNTLLQQTQEHGQEEDDRSGHAQHTATHCNTLQHTTTHYCNTPGNALQNMKYNAITGSGIKVHQQT